MPNPFFTDYAEYIARFFPGMKVQKISVNTGHGCPNRDGTIGTGGCIYCNNASFTPDYCFDKKPVSQQIEDGKRFFGRKYPNMQYIAYFQSYTGTHSDSILRLREEYREALVIPDVVGLAIGTRPDCLPDKVVEVLADCNKKVPLFVELGVESLCDETLKLINRGHNAAAVGDAVERLSAIGLHVGVHLIAGLPGEDFDRVLETVDDICRMPVESIKLHHLQVLKGTALHKMIDDGKVAVPEISVDEYLDFCVKVVERVPRRIAIERFLASAPPDMVVAPKWGLKNYQFNNLLLNKLKTQNRQI